MTSNGTSADKKRKITAISNVNSSNNNNNSSYHRYKQPVQQNPKRGGPGILLTCETGREYKARREALQILQQDFEVWLLLNRNDTTVRPPSDQNSTLATATMTTDETLKRRLDTSSTSSTLDEELAQLQQNRSKNISTSTDSPFAIYETGCKGTVLILYQPPDIASSSTTPLISTDTSSSVVAESTKFNNDYHKVHIDTKEIKTTDIASATLADEISAVVNGTEHHAESSIGWDPLVVVQHIVHDMALKTPNFTSSRYISRMIPIQKTCHATIDDISLAVQSLLEPIVVARSRNIMVRNGTTSEDNTIIVPTAATTVTTFAIQEKRRFCNHIKREPLITAVGNIVGAVTKGTQHEWTVNLSKPDYTVWIDICKTVAGISIIPDLHSYPRNFNLVEHRISLGDTENDSDDKK